MQLCGEWKSKKMEMCRRFSSRLVLPNFPRPSFIRLINKQTDKFPEYALITDIIEFHAIAQPLHLMITLLQF